MNEIDEYLSGLVKLQNSETTCQVTMDWGTAMAVVGACQLTLAHTADLNGPHRLLTKFVHGLLDQVEDIAPEMADVMRSWTPSDR